MNVGVSNVKSPSKYNMKEDIQKYKGFSNEQKEECIREQQIRTIWNKERHLQSLSFLKVKTLQKMKKQKLTDKKEPFNLEKIFPNDDQAIGLLKMMLQYNPHNRATAVECLNHVYFDSIRDKF